MTVAKRAVLTRVPFRSGLRRLKRRHVGYRPDAVNLRSTLANFDAMAGDLERIGRSFDGAVVLEIGTGWFPLIPVLVALRGARQVLMCDIEAHLDDTTIDAALAYLREARPALADRLPSRLDALGLDFILQGEIDRLEDASIDLVISRAVLEHIPVADLEILLRRLAPKLRPDGLMLHLIDHSDHLEHDDSSITPLNFLGWSARKHAFINALMKGGENRLRHREYAALFESCGYRVVSTIATAHAPTVAAVPSLRLAEPFARMPAEELAILTSRFVLSKQLGN